MVQIHAQMCLVKGSIVTVLIYIVRSTLGHMRSWSPNREHNNKIKHKCKEQVTLYGMVSGRKKFSLYSLIIGRNIKLPQYKLVLQFKQLEG